MFDHKIKYMYYLTLKYNYKGFFSIVARLPLMKVSSRKRHSFSSHTRAVLHHNAC